MKRASPVELRQSLEMANALASAGIRFVPVPVINDAGFNRLVDESSKIIDGILVSVEHDTTAQQFESLSNHNHALLIENGQLVADTLRHLADNEIDSDYFAITSTNENGTEVDHEMAITDYALQAAGTVDELVAALESAEKRIAELESALNRHYESPDVYDMAIKQFESLAKSE